MNDANSLIVQCCIVSLILLSLLSIFMGNGMLSVAGKGSYSDLSRPGSQCY